IKGHCGGATGHGVTDDEGTIYLPRGWCTEPYLAISRDEGLTWDRVRVADTDAPGGERYKLPTSGQGDSRNEEHEAGVAVDSEGNLYYTWTGADRLFYLATSTDGGKTWSDPKMIAAPGVTETWGPTIAVGAPGKIAVAYIGSTNAPGGIGADGTGKEYNNVSWNGYITMTDEALDKKPLYFSGTVNDPNEPLTSGKGCGILRCDSRIYDFLDVVIGPNGVPYASMVASQSAAGDFYPTWGTGFVGSMVGGPPLN
ncbi:MAG: glycoside hydrolase, partial [Actinobacteria bacterium]|nr:glycoside hydrolase [Actinomycetota bacterium]